MGIFGGLKNLGLGNMEGMDLYEEPKKEQEKQKPAAAAAPKIQEKDLIYDRSFVCPVCDSPFTAKIMKSNKARLLGTDQDLRARYDGIDAVKYDVVMCPVCAYAAIIRFFPSVTSSQAKLIREKISQNVVLTKYDEEIYSYEQAMERYKLALVNAVVKRAKAGEKAYICLKSAWVLRGYRESLQESGDYDRNFTDQLERQEEEFLENAYKGFSEARQSEMLPICGMNGITVDYLVAVLAMRFKDYNVAIKLLSVVITSSGTSPRIKDRARDMKDQIQRELKKQ
ncbi:DUF2225 domain-containing protein [bacterium D16-50]|jgi:uncharacterized protein (DUF2225 family)|nr:DUF2225 domain-containing protein [Lachnospiraceae bacterium]RKJ21346.1 DUF2225 domain-containing protein [bacterium D16-50]